MYPVSKKQETLERKFDTLIEDPYRWMENESDPDLKAWIEGQNNLTHNYLKENSNRQAIMERLKDLYDYPKYDLIKVVGSWVIYSHNQGLLNQPIYYRYDVKSQETEEILNPNKFSEDGSVSVTLNGWSKDHRYMAFLKSKAGSDWQEINVLDLKTKEILSDVITWVKFTLVSWYKDGFYYSAYEKPQAGKILSEKNQNMKVYYHKLGQKVSEDKVIYEDKDHPLRYHTLHVSRDEKNIVLSSSQGTYGNVLKIKEEDGTFRPLFSDFSNTHRYIGGYGDWIYILTDKEAPNKKIIKVNRKSLQVEDLIIEKDLILEDAYLINDKIIIKYFEDVISKIYVYNLYGEFEDQITLPGIGSVYHLAGSDDIEEIYFSFGSFIEPKALYAYNLHKKETKVFKSSKVNFDASKYVSKQIFCKSKDGTVVPAFLTYSKTMKQTGKNPTLLYAYGGFNLSLTPTYDPSVIYLLEQGGIFCVANIRGGSEYGDAWHRAGMGYNKQNVFDDFIGVAEKLIGDNYTSADYLAIQGRSNGGLLIGAVINQRPDLFKVAFPQVGVMDMLRYHKFTIGWGWAVEYGSPEEESHFRNILAYSPLHNIKSQDYPAVMVMTADHDDRVVPAHSYKYISTLQEKNTGKLPSLIRIDKDSGHGLGKSVEKLIEENADKYGFLFSNLSK